MVTITQKKNSVYVLGKRINHDQKKPIPNSKTRTVFQVKRQL